MGHHEKDQGDEQSNEQHPRHVAIQAKAEEIAWDDTGQPWDSLDHEAHCYYRELAQSELITFGLLKGD